VFTFSETIAWPDETEPTWSTGPGEMDKVVLEQAPDGSWSGTASLRHVPVAPTLGDLDPEMIASLSGTPASADALQYSLAPNGGNVGDPIATVQAGDVVLLWVENSRGSSLDPDIPSISGLGTWELLDPTDGTVIYLATGASRFRWSCFGFRASTTPTPAPVSISMPNGHIGCGAIMVRIPNAAVSAFATAKTKVNKDSGSGASSTLTLASPLDAANRAIYGAVVNTLQTFTKEAAHVKIGEVSHPNPTQTLMVAWRPDAFDTSSVIGWGGANQVHAMIGTELEQG